MKAKVKVQLAVLKNNALKLNARKQLPFFLVKCIYNIKETDSTEYVKLLMELTTHYLRVKDYYKIFASAEKQANEDIKGILEEKGYIND